MKRLEQLGIAVWMAGIVAGANALVQLDAGDIAEPREWLTGAVVGLATAVGAALLGFARPGGGT